MKVSYILPITDSQGIRLIDTLTALEFLKQTLDSAINQSIPNWELIIITQKKYQKIVSECIESAIHELSSASQLITKKKVSLKIVFSENSAKACNNALEFAKGKFVAIIQLGDQIAKHASYAIIKAKVETPTIKFAYSDHDFINQLGDRLNPFHKPDLSLDFLYCQNYIGSFGIFDRLMLKKLGGWNEKHEYAYDYDLNLRVIEHLNKARKSKNTVNDIPKIVHLPEVIYHQRIRKNNGQNEHINIRPIQNIEKIQSEDGLSVLKKHLNAINATVKVAQIRPKLYRHFWPIPKPEPLVSLIIPTRDGYDILKACVDSILQKTTYINYEIWIIDNQTTDPKTLIYLKNLSNSHDNIKILRYNKPFNYSALNNYAVSKTKGSIIGFINNDTEVISPDWLSEMVSHAIRPSIGAVGALLYYPDGSIQHAGVRIDGNLIENDFKYVIRSKKMDCFNLLDSIRNPPAVTAAALLLKKNVFNTVNGFDSKRFPIEFSDVDLCLRLSKFGFHSVWIPQAQLFHYESKTRCA